MYGMDHGFCCGVLVSVLMIYGLLEGCIWKPSGLLDGAKTVFTSEPEAWHFNDTSLLKRPVNATRVPRGTTGHEGVGVDAIGT